MVGMNMKTVASNSEELCLSWGGELRGEICVSIKIQGNSVKACLRGEARKLGGFEECYELLEACHTLLDVFLGKLRVCFSKIEYEDGIPRCFEVKIKFDPQIGSDLTILSERVCLFGILISEDSTDITDDLIINKNASPGVVVMVPLRDVE